ncbi:MAG: hypothetical protein AAB488_02550, partial [Patescibacteria group bacterium]
DDAGTLQASFHSSEQHRQMIKCGAAKRPFLFCIEKICRGAESNCRRHALPCGLYHHPLKLKGLGASRFIL